MNYIPKVINYCWFGNQKKDNLLRECFNSWKVNCKGYRIIEWNESNCNLNANKFIKDAVAQKKWAFISDYYRLVALSKEGGIYLDTDVEVLKSLDDLLSKHLFLGFSYESLIGTAVIGSEKNNSIIKKLISIYDNAYWIDNFRHFKVKEYPNYIFTDNNDLLTYFFKKNFPKFSLNGKHQIFNEFEIFSKDEFEIGKIFRGSYTVHKCNASWTSHRYSLKTVINKRIKYVGSKCPFIDFESLIRHISYIKRRKDSPFYNVYLKDKKR
ncbi:glycosyltransferase family 32 protein [Lactiplantibacillus pentosus]|uniref:glycosyltransferase family 32 protein n=1 Tax=Lactiplantibacillus pentosus TaxID=1589 RepID=UPI0021A7662A|nr:glycosyltransferase [Lactiplantibacillus pentosus]MCT3064854.1 mannosyltransferase [Lactiplantibacillus pentosus]